MVGWNVRGGGSVLLLEHILAYAAQGADVVVGEVFKLCARGDAVFGFALFGIVDIVADGADVFVHSLR